LEELDREQEEAAACLGASPWQIVFRVLLPTVAPAIVTGFSLAFARSLGEYGSVVFISGNMPYKTEITSLMIITKLEQHDLLGASSIATVMLLSSLLLLLAIHAFQWRMARHSVQ
jgi:sulfate transport system permease protein